MKNCLLSMRKIEGMGWNRSFQNIVRISISIPYNQWMNETNLFILLSSHFNIKTFNLNNIWIDEFWIQFMNISLETFNLFHIHLSWNKWKKVVLFMIFFSFFYKTIILIQIYNRFDLIVMIWFNLIVLLCDFQKMNWISLIFVWRLFEK